MRNNPFIRPLATNTVLFYHKYFTKFTHLIAYFQLFTTFNGMMHLYLSSLFVYHPLHVLITHSPLPYFFGRVEKIIEQMCCDFAY